MPSQYERKKQLWESTASQWSLPSWIPNKPSLPASSTEEQTSQQKEMGLFQAYMNGDLRQMYLDQRKNPDSYTHEMKTLVERLLSSSQTPTKEEEDLLNQMTCIFLAYKPKKERENPKPRVVQKKENPPREVEEFSIPSDNLPEFWWKD